MRESTARCRLQRGSTRGRAGRGAGSRRNRSQEDAASEIAGLRGGGLRRGGDGPRRPRDRIRRARWWRRDSRVGEEAGATSKRSNETGRDGNGGGALRRRPWRRFAPSWGRRRALCARAEERGTMMRVAAAAAGAAHDVRAEEPLVAAVDEARDRLPRCARGGVGGGGQDDGLARRSGPACPSLAPSADGRARAAGTRRCEWGRWGRRSRWAPASWRRSPSRDAAAQTEWGVAESAPADGRLLDAAAQAQPVGAARRSLRARRPRRGAVLMAAMARTRARRGACRPRGAPRGRWRSRRRGGRGARGARGLEVRPTGCGPAELRRTGADADGGVRVDVVGGAAGRGQAKRVVGDAARRAVEAGRPLRDEMLAATPSSVGRGDRGALTRGYLGSWSVCRPGDGGAPEREDGR